MKYLTVALPNDHELAGWIGKKGNANGLTFYNRRIEDTAITVLTPTNLAEKFYSLAECMTIGKVIIISTKTIDANFGEAVITASLLKKKVLLTNDNDVSGVIGKLGLDHQIVESKILLEALSESAAKSSADGELRIDIDKSFPVKGVGTVLLGIIRSGTVSSHDKLYSGAGKRVQIRSIQVQDEDNTTATVGARVGLAVKGIDDKDVEKGEVLAKLRILPRNEFRASMNFSPLHKGFSEETQYTLISHFEFVPCKIKKDGDNHRVILGKSLQIEKGQQFIIIRDKSPYTLCAGHSLD